MVAWRFWPLAASALITLCVFACKKSDDDGGSNLSPNPIGQDPEPYFRNLEADLKASCGGTGGRCHINGTYQNAPKFLGGPDAYASIKKYRGILPATKEVGDSIILTIGQHEGPALKDAPNDLYRRVADWLVAEVPPPPLPNTGSFAVTDGFNNVPLDNAGPGLTGGRITFLATQDNGVLSLSALRVVAPINANIAISAPFFVLLPRSGKVRADPDVNGFKGDLTVPAGEAVDFYTGKMVLLQWDQAGQLKIAFNKLESSPGQGVIHECTAIDAFKNNAMPAMRELVDRYDYDYYVDGGMPTVVGQNSCLGCHGQDTDPVDEAVKAMDLRGADMDPGKACAQARFWINFADKPNSTILLNPQGKGNPVHPIAPVPETSPIITGIKAWVDAEREK